MVKIQNFDNLLKPRGIAIIGASRDPAKLGFAVTRNLVESKFPGSIYPVNLKGGTLFDIPFYRSLAEVPDPVDLAVVIVPAAAAPQALKEAGERGIHAAILTSGGFRETGVDGAVLENAVNEVCKQFGIRLLGPNCVGIQDTHFPFDTTFLSPPLAAAGEIAFISHSGAFCAAVIDWSRGQGFGFSQMISLGNQADLTETDLLPAVAANPFTKTICLYLETISNGKRFIETTRELVRQKPIIALKVGRTASGQKAASSHTGALAGSEAGLNAALEITGVIRATTSEQLFDWAKALSFYSLPTGNKIAILTSAGGPGVIASDALEMEGLLLTNLSDKTEKEMSLLLPPAASVHNPIDMLASAGPVQYAQCLEILLESPNVDGVMVITLPPPNHSAEEIADALIPLIKGSVKPVLVAQMGSYLTATAYEHFIQAGIPVFPFPERAASALGVLYKRAIFLSKPLKKPLARKFSRRSMPSGGNVDDLLSAYGIPTAPLKLASTTEESVQIARQMTFPLAAKIASPQIIHKSDMGGVLLDLKTEKDVKKAYKILIERAKTAYPEAQIDGITLQAQVKSGQDVIIGAVRDHQFGPLMMFGTGGIEAEGLKDVAFALAPLDQESAGRLVDKTWAGRKLAGYRSIMAVDKKAVIDALVRLSWLVVEHPEITEIEINPLRALKEGIVALDTRMK